MTTDSILVLSQMLPPAESREHEEFLRKTEGALRENGAREISNYCKRGELFAAAKATLGHGYFLRWINESNARWWQSGHEDGFGWSEASIENYMNLHEWAMQDGESYYKYANMARTVGAGVMYKLARYRKGGRNVDELFATLQAKRLLAAGDDEQSSDPPAQQSNGAKPYAVQTALSAYPALREMVDRGDLHEQAAIRVAQAAEESNDYRVKNAVAQFGANSAETVGSIASVARSMDKAIAEGFTVKDDIFQQLATTGVIHTPMGDQVPLSEASPREVWGEYAMQRKETGASASAAKTVYRQEHTREAVLIFLEGAGETSYIPLIEHDAENQQYQITVRRLVAE